MRNTYSKLFLSLLFWNLGFGFFLQSNIAQAQALPNPPYCPVKITLKAYKDIIPVVTQDVWVKVTAIREGSGCQTDDDFTIIVSTKTAGTSDNAKANIKFDRRYTGPNDSSEVSIDIPLKNAPKSGDILYIRGHAAVLQDASFYNPKNGPQKNIVEIDSNPLDVKVCFVSCTTPQPTGTIPTATPTTPGGGGSPPNINVNTGYNSNTDYDADHGQFNNLVKPGSLPELIGIIIKILLAIIASLAVIVIIISGFRMVMFGSNPTELGKAKKAIAWSVIGLIVALMSFSIVAILEGIIKK